METGRSCRARWRIAAAAHNLCVLIGQIACQSSSLRTVNCENKSHNCEFLSRNCDFINRNSDFITHNCELVSGIGFIGFYLTEL